MVQHKYTTEQIPAGLAQRGTLLAVGPQLEREVFRVDTQTLRGETVVLEQRSQEGGPRGYSNSILTS
jgi:hypothetical protein